MTKKLLGVKKALGLRKRLKLMILYLLTDVFDIVYVELDFHLDHIKILRTNKIQEVAIVTVKEQ